MTEIGKALREARLAAGVSLTRMSREVHYSKGFLSLVETGDRAATADVVTAYERVLGGPILLGDNDMWRKEIRKAGILVVRGRKDVSELAASLAGGDAGPLLKTATAHWTDVALAARTDAGAARNLRRWMTDGETSTLRTNALSVIAKLPGRENADLVVRVLENDPRVRVLCLASVVSRMLQYDWDTSLQIAKDPTTAPNPKRLAKAMLKEAVNPRDTESRWCGATVLRDLAPVLAKS